ncbi:105_t:CDS:2 [Funneliformis geosporum]|uniref:105_t:CDS:1 n=1 Tax=Funneliformis geosporum TaxID=1117311 RepID=A0A9W4T4F8_9GLOM|nr:105_t:CDS:2 [Funneliformis geosporum]
MSTIYVNPSVETVEGWSVKQVKDFLNSKKDEFFFNDDEIAKVEENGINAGTSKSPNGLVFIFVDNSNLFIKGKYTVGNLEKVGTINRKRGSFYFNELRFDHGCLLSTEHIRSQGFKVVLYDRNVKNKEKKIDTSFVVDGMKVIMSEDPGIFVLIAGDGDYYPMILEALYRNWKVEVWFWTSGISGNLLSKEEKSRLSFYPLDDCYRYFTYASGPNFEKICS